MSWTVEQLPSPLGPARILQIGPHCLGYRAQVMRAGQWVTAKCAISGAPLALQTIAAARAEIRRGLSFRP
jgi:hypothetical protein